MKSGIALIAVCLACPAAAQVYKCPDASGKNVFQDSPCDGSVKRTVRDDNPFARSDVPKELSDTYLRYLRCVRLFPELGAKHNGRYFAWHKRHAAAVEKMQRPEHAHGPLVVDAENRSIAMAAPAVRERRKQECDAELERLFAP